MSRWISVDLAMPLKDIGVLVTDGDDVWEAYRAESFDGDEVWMAWDGQTEYKEKITHWMPEPEPPRIR